MEIGMLPGFPDKEESHGVYKKNQTKISVAETAFLINPLVFAERLGGKRDPASGRPQAGGGRKIPNCKTINTAKKQKKQRKKKPTGLRCLLCYKKLRVLHISEGIWGGDARSLVSSPGLQGENATQRAQPYQDCQQQKLQVLKKGEATRGHKIVVNWVILCRRKGIRAANPPRLCPRRREPSPTHLFLSYCHCGEGGDLLFVGRGGPRVFQLAQELQRQHQM